MEIHFTYNSKYLFIIVMIFSLMEKYPEDYLEYYVLGCRNTQWGV